MLACPGLGGGLDSVAHARPPEGGTGSMGHSVEGLAKNPCSGMMSCESVRYE